MRRKPLPWAASTLAVALALAGCATGGPSDPAGATGTATDSPLPALAGRPLPQPEDPSSLRVPARVMRIWIAPWEDGRGDLHAPGYLYTEIESRRWTLGAPAEAERATLIRPLQIERREAPADARRSGRDTDNKRPGRDPGGAYTPGRTRGPETRPNLLGS
jgi:hypothetical protein